MTYLEITEYSFSIALTATLDEVQEVMDSQALDLVMDSQALDLVIAENNIPPQLLGRVPNFPVTDEYVAE